MRYAHTNIISLDLKKLSEFYIEIFECQTVPPVRSQSGNWLSKGTGVENAKLEGVHLLLPGHGKNDPTLEIYQYDQIQSQEPINPNTRGFGHLAFEVDDVKMVVDKIVLHGGNSFGQITSRQLKGVGEITFVYARDPEGNLIELQNWR